MAAACSLLLSGGTGAATSEGVQRTALVAMVFVAAAAAIYCFYNDKEVVRAIREDASQA